MTGIVRTWSRGFAWSVATAAVVFAAATGCGSSEQDGLGSVSMAIDGSSCPIPAAIDSIVIEFTPGLDGAASSALTIDRLGLDEACQPENQGSPLAIVNDVATGSYAAVAVAKNVNETIISVPDEQQFDVEPFTETTLTFQIDPIETAGNVSVDISLDPTDPGWDDLEDV